MKKILFVFVFVFSILSLCKTQPIINCAIVRTDTTGIDSLKNLERKYNWFGKSLTRKEYLDTLEKKFKVFNDSLRKEQGIKD